MALSLDVQMDDASTLNLRSIQETDRWQVLHSRLNRFRCKRHLCSERSAPDAWAILNEQHTKMQHSIPESRYDNTLTLYLKFNVKILQITETKHCVISPVNLRVLCQGCMKPFSQPAIEQDEDIQSMCKSCLASVRKTNHFVHHVETFFKGVT